jgi:hypothetical protein
VASCLCRYSGICVTTTQGSMTAWSMCLAGGAHTHPGRNARRVSRVTGPCAITQCRGRWRAARWRQTAWAGHPALQLLLPAAWPTRRQHQQHDSSSCSVGYKET